MKLRKISLADTHSFTPFFLDYIQQNDSLKNFYHRYPEIKNFKEQLAEKSASFSTTHRQVLTQTLREQYKNYKTTEQVTQNIERLNDSKTFTVTTGHQLNIFTGPLYFIYKIVTVINTCKALKDAYPDYNFVPVYWMASEDHDYDEIKYFRLQGKKYVWETKQTGAIGRFNPKELDSLLKEIPGDISLFREAYTKHATLSDAVRYYADKLFGAEGLVVVDGDSRALKNLFNEVIKDDLYQHTSKKLVDQTNASLEKVGYKPQVFSRDINLFYLDEGVRGRLEKVKDRFVVVDTDHTITASQIDELIAQEPEKFSPNVVLRPLYQETILPNLAYVGGPAEVVYWLQLKDVFTHFRTPFPILMPRNFSLVMDAPTVRKFEKTGLELVDFFQEKSHLFNYFAA
jgi:bacillithiol biosynthesis cysteine-adding enzyme BshC